MKRPRGGRWVAHASLIVAALAGRDAPAGPLSAPMPPARHAETTAPGLTHLAPVGAPACADPRIEGVHIPAIDHPNRACGIVAPVRVTALGGVRLSIPATLECETARRVALWMQSVVRPSARRVLGTEVASARVMGSYVCRTRNHKPGARISEHAQGRAIDIGGFTLTDGREITVRDDWGRGDAGLFLGLLRRQACGLFKTVLGPGSDAYHEGHFHLDTARRRGRPWCP